MFFCEPCRKSKGWPQSIRMSKGRCEVCGGSADCHDVPSRHLPPRTLEASHAKPNPFGVQENAVAKLFDERRMLDIARREEQQGANSRSQPPGTGHGWLDGFLACAALLRRPMMEMAIHQDKQSELMVQVAKTRCPKATILSADKVRHYGTTLALDKVADLVADATGIDRDRFDWVKVDGEMELWIGEP